MKEKINWDIVIGLEVHVQLNTLTKLFCKCKNEALGQPNSKCCPICIGLPGTLPVPNKLAIEKSISFGIAAKSKINNKIQFARKNYFYPDLPKGYQTSQFSLPICEKGKIKYFHNQKLKEINLIQAHIEEDAGKLIHAKNNNFTYIDLNRCGSPLLEIVSEPEIKSASEAKSYLTYLRKLIKSLNIADCDMEKGQFRCDANISLRKNKNESLGTRTEIKNINSFRHVEKAINHEINRQKEILQKGDKIKQCTIQYHDKSNTINIIRSKENTEDYRYFPCPDLPPVLICKNDVLKIKSSQEEAIIEKILRFQNDYKLSFVDANRICNSHDMANFYEAIVSKISNPNEAKNLILGEISSILKSKNIKIDELPISLNYIQKSYKLKSSGKISSINFKKLLQLLANSNKKIDEIIEENNLISKEKISLDEIFKKIKKNYKIELQRYLDGENRLKGFLIGQFMRITKGKTDPKEIAKYIENIKK